MQLAEVRYNWKHIEEWCALIGISVMTWCEQQNQRAFDSYMEWKTNKTEEKK